MPTTTPAATIPGLDAQRRPIHDYTPEDSAGRNFRAGMLGLADELEELGSEADSALEIDIIWTALHAFPGLVEPGPPPAELVDLTLGGHLINAETADTLHTLATVRRVLQGFEPPGFAATLFRAALLAIYQLIGVFVVFGDERAINQCLDLLDIAERMADRLTGQA